MQTKTYRITNMECPNCAIILESIEDKLPGIRSARASYKTGEMTVTFDEQLVSEAEIITAIQKKGYIIGAVKTE
ncbi:MAG: hypothetical protein DDG60_03045 [Anaerolineae bacterium]|nr:MAG: hypothetical protein DDG60_03045 [Anaerolineae bacterium]